MRSTDFSQILTETAQLCGLDRANLQAQDFRMIRDLCSSRLNIAWARHKWPELRRVVQTVPNCLVYDVSFSGGTTFRVLGYSPLNTSFTSSDSIILSGVSGTGVDDLLNATLPISSVIAQASASTNGGFGLFVTVAGYTSGFSGQTLSLNQPTVSLKLEDEPDRACLTNRYPYDLTAFPVGELLAVWDSNPDTDKDAAKINYALSESPYQYYANLLGSTVNPQSWVTTTPQTVLFANLITGATSPLWLEYTYSPPTLYGDAYSASTQYYVGAQVYYDTSTSTGAYAPGSAKPPAGNFYECITQPAIGTAPTNTTYWKRIYIPHIFARYLPRAIMADYLRSEQQWDIAQAAELDAEGILELEAHKLYNNQRQIPQIEVRVY